MTTIRRLSCAVAMLLLMPALAMAQPRSPAATVSKAPAVRVKVPQPELVPAAVAPPFDQLPADTRKQLAAGQTVDILKVIHDDAAASLQDANDNQDTLASACYGAIIIVTEAKIAAQNVPGGGIILVFQKLRDLTRLNASPLGLTLISGCAALGQDAKLGLVDLFTKLGAAVLLKGVLL